MKRAIILTEVSLNQCLGLRVHSNFSDTYYHSTAWHPILLDVIILQKCRITHIRNKIRHILNEVKQSMYSKSKKWKSPIITTGKPKQCVSKQPNSSFQSSRLQLLGCQLLKQASMQQECAQIVGPLHCKSNALITGRIIDYAKKHGSENRYVVHVVASLLLNS